MSVEYLQATTKDVINNNNTNNSTGSSNSNNSIKRNCENQKETEYQQQHKAVENSTNSEKNLPETAREANI